MPRLPGGSSHLDIIQHAADGGLLGLRGIQERVALVGGTLTIETAPEKGTTLFVHIPLPAER